MNNILLMIRTNNPITNNPITNNPITNIRYGELYMRYKSSYLSASIDLTVYLLLILSSIYSLWLCRDGWLSALTIPFLGLMLHRTFVVQHDCSHNSYTPSKMINTILAQIFGILVFTSANWIVDHHTHHMTNGNIENKYNFKFNELLYWNKKQYLSFNSVSRAVFRFFHTPIIFFTFFPMLYFFVIQRFIYVVKKYKYREKIIFSSSRIIYNHLINNTGCLLLCMIAHDNQLLYHLIASSYIGFLINFILFFNQHTYNPPYVVGDREWTQIDSGLRGSSFIQIPRILRYFTMGIEYHHIHHITAKIPGYNLSKYHEDVVSRSNLFDRIIRLSLRDCYENLWLCMYDADRSRYITIAEASKKL